MTSPIVSDLVPNVDSHDTYYNTACKPLRGDSEVPAGGRPPVPNATVDASPFSTKPSNGIPYR